MTGFAVLALLASVLLGVGDFLGGTLSRKVPLLTVLVLSQLVATIVVLPRLLWPEPGGDLGQAILWGVVGGAAVSVGVSSLYKALAIGTMGVVAPIAALSVLVPVVAGIASGDPLGPLLIAGMAVAVVGTVLASGPEVRKGGARGGALPILLALLAAAGFGVSNLTLAWGSAHNVTATLLGNSLAALVIYVIAALVTRTVPRASGWPLVGIAAIGVLGFAANLCFALASLSGLLSVVAVFASLFPAVTALLGWWVHKERLSLLQAGGVLLVFAGVGVIAAST
jgi:drug/metabolite transporter (DMT)-like permease